MYSYMLKHTYLLYISIANNNDDKLYRYCGYHLSVQKLMLYFWTREHITYCNCGALSCTHTHYPCFHCNGKAVSRSTEYRHWQRVNTERFVFMWIDSRCRICITKAAVHKVQVPVSSNGQHHGQHA